MTEKLRRPQASNGVALRMAPTEPTRGLLLATRCLMRIGVSSDPVSDGANACMLLFQLLRLLLQVCLLVYLIH